MKTIEEKARAYDKVRKKIAIRFGSNVADEFFAEFEESEDEKARKAIMALIEWSKSYSASGITNDDAKKMLAWLEKQGEQKSQRTISAEAKEALFDYENANIKQKDFAPNDEQKPAEQQMYWTEEEIEPIISDYLCGREHYGGMIGRLCHLKPKQKQAEWGEDDEAFLDDILCKLEHDLILNKDEKDWLKSLRPQNTWKPSDEQIAQLQIAVDTYGNEGIYDPILTELLFQLKKLKEDKV